MSPCSCISSTTLSFYYQKCSCSCQQRHSQTSWECIGLHSTPDGPTEFGSNTPRDILYPALVNTVLYIAQTNVQFKKTYRNQRYLINDRYQWRRRSVFVDSVTRDYRKIKKTWEPYFPGFSSFAMLSVIFQKCRVFVGNAVLSNFLLNYFLVIFAPFKALIYSHNNLVIIWIWLTNDQRMIRLRKKLFRCLQWPSSLKIVLASRWRQ